MRNPLMQLGKIAKRGVKVSYNPFKVTGTLKKITRLFARQFINSKSSDFTFEYVDNLNILIFTPQ